MKDEVVEARNIIDRFRLDGRTALVTGAAQGIGRAYAHALGEAGAKVAIVDINLEKAEEVVQELESKGIDSMAIQTDVTKKNQAEKMVETVVSKWGKLTIGVNNAASVCGMTPRPCPRRHGEG